MTILGPEPGELVGKVVEIINFINNGIQPDLEEIQIESTRTEMYDSFADKGTTPLTVSDSGHVYTLLDSGALGAGLSIITNKLTNTATVAGAAAGYASVVLENDVKRIGAEFTFGPYTTSGGSVVLAVPISPVNFSIPDMACHLRIGPTIWQYDYFEGGVLTNIAGGTFSPPLTADNTTIYSAEVILDGDTATIRLPDGSLIQVTDSHIASNVSPNVFWEVYAFQAVSDSKGKFTNIWAESIPSTYGHSASVVDVLPQIVRSVSDSRPAAITYSPLVNSDVVVPTVITAIDPTNLALTFTVPAGCTSMLIEMVGTLSMSTFGFVVWGYYEAGGISREQLVTYNEQRSGVVVFANVETGLVPGSTHTIVWRHFSTVGGIAIFKLDDGSGLGATMKATPLNS